MAIRGKLKRLEKALQGNMGAIELADGSRYWFDPDKVCETMFMFFMDSLRAAYHRQEYPESPEILRTIAGARDREKAFRVFYPDSPPFMLLDERALIERGEIVHRAFVAGRHADEPLEGLSE